MNNKLFHQIKRAFTIASALLGLISYSLPVLSLPNTLTSNSSNKMLIHFKQQEEDGSSRGRPARREGTGSRGSCSPVNVPVTPWYLLPMGDKKAPLNYCTAEFLPGDYTHN